MNTLTSAQLDAIEREIEDAGGAQHLTITVLRQLVDMARGVAG